MTLASKKFDDLELKLKEQVKALAAKEQKKQEAEKPLRRVVRPQEKIMPANVNMSAVPDIDDEYDDEDFDEDLEENDDEEEDDEPEEDEEDDEPEEDEEDDDLAEEASPPPPPKLVTPPAAPKRRGRPPKNAPKEAPKANLMPDNVVLADALSKNLRKEQAQEDANDLWGALSSLDLGAGNHKFTLTRSQPEFYEGKAITGYLRQFTSPITPEDIKQQFGGGTFIVTVTGPRADGKKYGIVARRQITIAGDPIAYDKDGSRIEPKKKPSEEQNAANSLLPMFESVLKTKEEDARRAREDAKEAQKQMLAAMRSEGGGMKDIIAAITALANPSSMREEMREDRKLQELRMAQEREERRREQELQRQMHEKQLEQMRMEHQRSLEMMKLEQQRLQQEALHNAGRSESMFKDFLTISEKMNAEKEARARESSAFIIESMKTQQQMQMQQMQEMEKMKTSFFMEQMKALKGNDEMSGLEKLLKYKEFFNNLTGSGEGDGKATWEKIMDRVSESAPSMLAVAGSMFNRPGAISNPTPPPALPAPAGPRQGTVAVVDLPPQTPRRKKTSPLLRRERPQAAPPQPQVEEAVVEAAAPAPTPEVIVDAVPATENTAPLENNLTEFTFPQDNMPMDQLVQLLVQNIDLAVQKNMDSEEVFKTVVLKFPKATLDLFKMVPPDQAVQMIKEAAPADWYINTPSGAKMIKELFEELEDM